MSATKRNVSIIVAFANTFNDTVSSTLGRSFSMTGPIVFDCAKLALCKLTVQVDGAGQCSSGLMSGGDGSFLNALDARL